MRGSCSIPCIAVGVRLIAECLSRVGHTSASNLVIATNVSELVVEGAGPCPGANQAVVSVGSMTDWAVQNGTVQLHSHSYFVLEVFVLLDVEINGARSIVSLSGRCGSEASVWITETSSSGRLRPSRDKWQHISWRQASNLLIQFCSGFDCHDTTTWNLFGVVESESIRTSLLRCGVRLVETDSKFLKQTRETRSNLCPLVHFLVPDTVGCLFASLVSWGHELGGSFLGSLCSVSGSNTHDPQKVHWLRLDIWSETDALLPRINQFKRVASSRAWQRARQIWKATWSWSLRNHVSCNVHWLALPNQQNSVTCFQIVSNESQTIFLDIWSVFCFQIWAR